MKRLWERILKNLAVPALSLSLMLNPQKTHAETREKRMNYAGSEYSIILDNDEKEYNIKPYIDSEEASKEILASVLLEDAAESVENKIKGLEKEIQEVVWKNPSRIYFNFSEKDAALSENLRTYSHFPLPQAKVRDVWRKGDKINLEFKLDSQEYIFDWYKNCSIVFLYESDVKLFRAEFDKIIALKTDKKAGFNNFEEHELKINEEIEVSGMLNEAMLEKAVDLVPKVGGFPSIMQIVYTVENWLAEQERASRESIIENLKNNFRLIRYTPKYWAASPDEIYETGRNILLQFEGEPRKIYAFINVNTKLNPLKEAQRAQDATQTSLQESYDAPLLKLMVLNPGQVKDKGTAGQIINGSQKMVRHIDEILSGYKHKKELKRFNLNSKREEYFKIKRWDSQLWPLITFLNRIKSKDLKGGIEELPEFKKFRQEAAATEKSVKDLDAVIKDYHFKKDLIKKIYVEVGSGIELPPGLVEYIGEGIRITNGDKRGSRILSIEKNGFDNLGDFLMPRDGKADICFTKEDISKSREKIFIFTDDDFVKRNNYLGIKGTWMYPSQKLIYHPCYLNGNKIRGIYVSAIEVKRDVRRDSGSISSTISSIKRVMPSFDD